MNGQFKLLAHQVITPFDPFAAVAGPDRAQHNAWVKKWWDDRKDWLAQMGKGSWNAYRVPMSFTCFVDGCKPAEGNNNIPECVFWCFDDAQTAALFKLTFA